MKLLALLTLLLSLGLPGVALGQRARSVQTATVQRQDVVRSAAVIGTLAAWEQAVVVPRVTGYLVELAVEEGDVLAAGALVARVDVPDLVIAQEAAQARVAELEAKTEETRAGIAQGEAGIVMAESRVTLREAEVRAGETELELKRMIHERLKKLHESRAATREMLDDAEGELVMAGARLEAARAARRAAHSEVTAARAHLEAARAAVTSAEATVTRARKEAEGLQVLVDFAALRNPYTRGLVSMRYLDRGALVREGESQVVGLKDVSRMRLRIDVPESDATLVAAGTPAVIRFDAFPGRSIEATVTRTARVLDPRTRTMRAEIVLDNAADELMPGMFAHVRLVTARRPDALTVPGSAIYAGDGEPYVMIVKDDLTRRAKVEIGVDDGIVVEILSGLTGDEVVILGRPTGLRVGDRVTTSTTGGKP